MIAFVILLIVVIVILLRGDAVAPPKDGKKWTSDLLSDLETSLIIY